MIHQMLDRLPRKTEIRIRELGYPRHGMNTIDMRQDACEREVRGDRGSKGIEGDG